MAVRDRLPKVDTLGEFETAREERWRDGLVLAVRGRRMGAAYLLGYVVEMTLKSVVYRLWDFRPGDPINRETLVTIRELARADLGVDVNPEGFHNPVFWGRIIVMMRIQLECPLEQGLGIELVDRTLRIYSNWNVSMRYCRDRVSVDDLRDLVEDTMWVQSNYDVLVNLQV